MRPLVPAVGLEVLVGLAEALEERSRDQLLSIYVDSAPALVRADTNNGQNGVLFLKLYDRLYYRTDRYVYSYNLEDVRGSVTIGEKCHIAGATIRNQRTVGAYSTVGLGAVVVKDVEKGTTVIGNPARPMNKGGKA